jgi:hypothetical protein
MRTHFAHWYTSFGRWWEPPEGERKGEAGGRPAPRNYIFTLSTLMVSPSMLPLIVTLWPA